jgi:hypothetical protein
LKNYLKIFFIIFLLLPFSLQAQNNSAFKKFSQLSRPEKFWVIRHPFIAKKTLTITQKVLLVTDSIAKTTTLDGDKSGGQVDAFRHAYWMASLAQNIGWRKALKLGRAHEKANHIDFKKHRLEEGQHPDKASGDMDIYNNKVGIEIAKANKKLIRHEMQQEVTSSILAGKMKIIKKDSLGNFLGENNNIIPADSLKGKWNNGKCLVNSDWKRK